MSWKTTLRSLAIAALLAVPAAADWTAGVAAFKAGDLAAAEAEFRAITEARPEWAGGHLMLGQTLLRDGRTEEALASLERAYELAPGDPQTSLVLGQTYVQLERFADAAEVLRDVAAAALPEAQKLALYRTRAAAATRSDKPALAIADLETALALKPDDAELHRQLGQAARAAGLTATAIAYFGRAVELSPEDVYSTRSLVKLLYDQALSAESDAQADLCENVMPHARRLVELDESYENLVLLAEAARCVGLHDATATALELAAAERPNEWWPHYALGRLHAGREAWVDAEAALKRALVKEVPAAEEPGILKRLGYVYERQQRLEEALEQYRLAGDAESVARVEKNLVAQREEEMLAKLAAEKKRIEEELESLEGGGL